MDSDDYTRPKSIGDLPAREYAVRAAKASIFVVCWAGIAAVLLIYGPPAMSVPTASGPLHAGGTVDAAFGILLSAGTATFLTIILVVGVLAYTDRQRAQSDDRQRHEAADSTEDETHA